MYKIGINKIWIVLGLGLIALSYLRWPLWPDHSLFLYAGNLWFNGSLPYKDIFDLNWPGTIWIAQINCAIFGDTPGSVRLFDILWQCATCFVLYRLSIREINHHSAYLAIFLYLALYLAASFGGTAQREGFASLFLGLALLLLYRKVPCAFISGILMGLAALIKPTLLTIPLLFVLYGLVLIPRRNYELIKKIVLAASGVFVVFVSFFALMYFLNILPAFIDAGFIYAIEFTGRTAPLWLAKRMIEFLIIYPPGRLLLVLIGLLFIFRKNLHATFNYSSMLIIFTLGSFLSVLAQRHFAYYHTMPFCFFGSLLFCKIAYANWNKNITFFGKNIPLVCIFLVFIFPIGYDLPKSIFSTLTLESGFDYGNKRRAERELISWQAIQNSQVRKEQY